MVNPVFNMFRTEWRYLGTCRKRYRFYMFDKGRIVGHGTYEDLLKNSSFQKILKKQYDSEK